MSLEDRLAILDGIAAYVHRLDDGDDEGWVELFTEDAVWENYARGSEKPSIRHEGQESIRQFAAWMRGRRGATLVRHYKGNPLFLELTRNLARVRANGMITVQAPAEEPRLAQTGVYVETWRRTEDGWRIAHLVFHNDRPAPT